MIVELLVGCGGVFSVGDKIYQIVNKCVCKNFKVINEQAFKFFFCIKAFFCRGKEETQRYCAY